MTRLQTISDVVTFPVVAALATAGLSGDITAEVRTASAQSAPTLTVQSTSDPLVWQVDGEGFAPGEELRVISPSCLPFPCGAGGYASTLVTVGADGGFSTSLDFRLGLPDIRGEVFVSAFPRNRAAQADDILVPIPFDFTTYTPVASSPTPGTPNVGNSHSTGDDTSALAMVAILGALGILGLGMAARARRASQ